MEMKMFTKSYYDKYMSNKDRDWAMWVWVIVLSIMALSGISYCSWYHWPREKPAQVVWAQWTWKHLLHQKTKYHAEEWGKPYGKDVIPGTLKCERRYYGEEDCFCHDICSGTGENETCFSACLSCAVYKDWCMYDHWLWPVIKQDQTSGPSTEVPHWPSLAAEGSDQRIEQVQEYDVTFENEPPELKRCIHHPTSYEDISRFVHGNWWKVKTNAGFGVCDPLVLLTAEGGS